jgi:RimJ/RimL family protein N-acetyltransferase
MVLVHPRIETARLKLRPFLADDAEPFSDLAGAREIADTMISLPHPLSIARARSSIAAQAADFQAERSVHFAVEHRRAPGLIGAVELRDVDRDHSQAELSFWIAVSQWGRGYAAEAAHAVVQHGFVEVELNRIYAHHMLRNPASGAVLRKIGMKLEGVLRERVCKWGVYEDVAIHAILRSDTGR